MRLSSSSSTLEEFGVAILLTLLVKKMPRGTWTTAVQAEFAGGEGIFAYCAFAYALTDGLVPQ